MPMFKNLKKKIDFEFIIKWKYGGTHDWWITLYKNVKIKYKISVLL